MRRDGVTVPRKPTLIVLLLVVTALVSGCSRLTFVRPEMGREDFRRTAPEVDVRTDDRDRGSSAVLLLVRQGQQQLATGDLDTAGKTARAAVEQGPDSAPAHTLLALVEDRRGSTRGAGEHYRRAVELAPNQGAMLNNYGTWLCGQGQLLESLPWFEKAWQDTSYPSPSVALANAGACAFRAGAGDRAGQYLVRAIELDPVNPVALGTMAEREFLAGRAFQARAFSQRRLAAAPADARALLLASQIEEKLGDKVAAARYVQQLRAEFPTASGSEMGNGGNR